MSECRRQRIPYCEGCIEKNERCPNVFVHSLGIHRIIFSEEERKFPLGV